MLDLLLLLQGLQLLGGLGDLLDYFFSVGIGVIVVHVIASSQKFTFLETIVK